MAYTISNTDGSTLVLVPEKTVDEISTSLTLVGRNVNGFGEYINNNFVKLAANFANDSINPPRSPLKGQLWYDTTVKKLKLYDNGFKVIGGAVVSPTLPSSLTTGDLWYDNSTNQLKIINDTGNLVIGPAFPFSIGENGWVLPATSVRDDNLRTKNVTFLKNYGNLLGVISHENYIVNPLDSQTYFGTSTGVTLVAGLKVFGDLSFTGKTNNAYHTLTVDINVITSSSNNISNLSHMVAQTNAIIAMLSAVFPINSQTNYLSHPLNSRSIEPGVLVDSEARVICYHTVPFKGYQVRRFKAKQNATWDYVELFPTNIFSTLSNVITTVALP